MSRLINVYHSGRKNLLENYNNIDISDIGNIINHSSDLIRFDHLQLFEQKIAAQILSILINKLKLNGTLVISLFNIKNISRLYADLVLSDEQFIEKMQDCKSVWSIEFLKDFIDKNYKDIEITQIQYDNSKHLTYITAERKSL